MPSTFLELTNKLLTRFNENNMTESEFSSRRGVHRAAADYINDALRKLNATSYAWPFNEAEGTQVLTEGQVLYNWPSDFKVADMNSFYIEKSDTFNNNTRGLREISKEKWYETNRDHDFDNDVDGVSIPDYVFIYSHNQFGVTQVPSEAYTVKFKYWTKFTPLVNATDETVVPQEWDMVIIDLATPYMWDFRTNGEMAAKAAKTAENSLAQMRDLLVNDEFQVHVNMNTRRYHGAHYFQGRP